MFVRLQRCRLRQTVANFLKARTGNVAVIFAIALVPLIGFVGAGVDYSNAGSVKAALQSSLDSALLAGATQPVSLQLTEASTFFSGNYNQKTRAEATASFTQGSDGSISGTATSSVPASFLGVLGIKTITVTASGTAVPGASTKSDVCILLVNPQRTQALLVNSGAVLKAPNCEVHVLSTQSPAAIFNTTLDVKRICVKGSTVIKNGGASPPVETVATRSAIPSQTSCL